MPPLGKVKKRLGVKGWTRTVQEGAVEMDASCAKSCVELLRDSCGTLYYTVDMLS